MWSLALSPAVRREGEDRQVWTSPGRVTRVRQPALDRFISCHQEGLLRKRDFFWRISEFLLIPEDCDAWTSLSDLQWRTIGGL